MVLVTSVDSGSAAEKAGVQSGDILATVNGHEIKDILDYRFYIYEKKIILGLERGGKAVKKTIRKKEYDDIGLEFETPLMDHKKTCRNKCIFCFIDQMPKGMRETLYFKDDDERLGFLHGNYVTLTNLSDEDIHRICYMHLSPINISVHTTDPELRQYMMKNKRSGEVLEYIPRLLGAGIQVNTQIVLCRGVNDGPALEKTLSDLLSFEPHISSCSVVPAGLTDHREGLYHLEPFTKDECRKVIETVNRYGDEAKRLTGERIFYASDEFYISAGESIPETEFYDDFLQLENGVGMMSLFREETEDAIQGLIDDEKKLPEPRKVVVVTGKLAYPLISAVIEKLASLCYNLECRAVAVENLTFGKNITVSGLLTGCDIYAALKDEDLSGCDVLVPYSAIRKPEMDFLCGMTLDELSVKLGCRVGHGGRNGYDFVSSVLGYDFG